MRSGAYHHFTSRVFSFPERNAHHEAVHDAVKYVHAEHANEGFTRSIANWNNSLNTDPQE